MEFLSWFLNSLHTTLGGTKKATSSVIYKTFQGKMRVTSRKLPQTENDEEIKKVVDEEEYKETTSNSPYMYLMLDIPPSPLYKDEYQQNIIPQVPLFQLLSKFDGKTEKEYKTYKETFVKKFELTKLPNYLIMCLKRFNKNMFFKEKNPTVVNFPVKGVDMAEYLVSDPAIQDAHPHTQYDLIANICHEGEPGKGAGNFKVHILHKGANKWYELQDLHVKDILPPVITLSDSYIQIYELQKESNTQKTTAT